MVSFHALEGCVCVRWWDFRLQEQRDHGFWEKFIQENSVFEAELPDVIQAIDITIQKGWRALRLEMDSLLTVKALLIV